MAPRNVIQRAFDQFGKAAGMTKRSGSWHLASDEVISVTNLQKSQYGPSYYVNQGWWLVEAEEGEPRSETCHVVTRIENLLPTREGEINRLLDLDVPIPDPQREERLRWLLAEELLPVLREAATVAGLRALRLEGRLTNAGLRRLALERLV